MESFKLVMPVVSLSVLGLGLLMLTSFAKVRDSLFGKLSLLGTVLLGGYPVLFLYSRGGAVSSAAMLSWDSLGLFFYLVCLAASLAAIALIPGYFSFKEVPGRQEAYPLIVFALTGMVVMASANHFLMFLLGLEMMSLCFYVLAGILREQEYAVESSLKYFILGVFSSSLLILGMGFIYGSTGELSYARIFDAMLTGDFRFGEPMVLLGFVLLLAGLFFKLSLVPFHFWAPDVYQGAPTPVTALLSVGGKAAALAATMRLFLEVICGSELLSRKWFALFAILGIVTVFTGSLIALTQSRFKRLLAYSSIVHAGFLALGIAAMAGGGGISPKAVQALGFYAAAYLFMNVSAFVCAQAIEKRSRMDEELSSLSGLGSTSPVFAALLSLNFLSLAGIPLTAGFLGKFYIFSALVEQGTKPFYWIAALGLLGAVIATFYYLKVLVILYFPSKEQIPAPPPKMSPESWAVLLICSFFTVLFGVFPGAVLALADIVTR
ncbi:MAG TPA: NADH-quinone oxidoreductase subunit N [Acidobacteriota bacterium]|nr:NADH-quinone oxidoreductase subunit N [Acidobacteriota bacterium]HNT16841.1 NADH-quinone oxidoreductase subunit N [Acidobacteriota bacterium]HPA28079.1 NADH-quinone oxidoreductase subunit N [Acidobacteriota bacterium]HQO19638.1 NADH-quinone oxidoreductase subunit N [Acidobacteriota bacterium]HQQ46187.1 NADH-quinone oxidoreductase subunit N [Acidobacteriota bacterium]